jgi:RimJ/RimL family protein N-acetyltransferase
VTGVVRENGAVADVPTVETDRLVLRELRDEDLDGYHAMQNDPEVYRFLGGEGMSRNDAWRHMAMMAGHWALRGYGLWAVVEKETGAFVGRVGPWRPEGWPGLEVGWTLAREHWGKGYATEAARASVRYAFDELGADRVISLIDAANERSLAVSRRLGQTYEREWELDGKPIGIYGVDRAAFRALA